MRQTSPLRIQLTLPPTGLGGRKSAEMRVGVSPTTTQATVVKGPTQVFPPPMNSLAWAATLPLTTSQHPTIPAPAPFADVFA
jgi:hypothetical protein